MGFGLISVFIGWYFYYYFFFMFFLDDICLDIKVVVLVFLLIKESKIKLIVKIVIIKNFFKLCILEGKKIWISF